MAIASGRAAQILAQPLYLRLNGMCTLNTHEVVCLRTSKLSYLGLRLPIIVQFDGQKGNLALGFSPISVYLMVILYFNEAHATCAAKFIHRI